MIQEKKTRKMLTKGNPFPWKSYASYFFDLDDETELEEVRVRDSAIDQGSLIDGGLLTCYMMLCKVLNMLTNNSHSIPWISRKSRDFRMALARALFEDSFEPMIKMLIVSPR